MLALLIRRRKKCRRQRRRWWVKPWIRRRVLFGQYHTLMMEINRECLGDFVNYMRCPVFAHVTRATKRMIVRSSYRVTQKKRNPILIILNTLVPFFLGHPVQPIARSYDISCDLSLNLTTLAFNRATLAYRRKTHRLILTSVSHNGRYLAQCIVRASYERFFLCDNSCDQE